MSNHTPTPWKVDHGSVYTIDGKPVTGSFATERDANAHFIVQACNSHDALVDALRDLVALYPDLHFIAKGQAALAKARGDTEC